MSTPSRDEIIAIYRREAAREVDEVAAGRMKESTHATVLACVRTQVHYLLRTTPEGIAAQKSERPETPGITMQAAWKQADELIRAAGVWDTPPPIAPVAVAPVAAAAKVVTR